jgi:nitronate monooxygenase
MGSPLADLGLSNPVIAAPMAGGATTPELVIAAARTGSLGLLAGGMRPPDLLAGDIAKVRSETDTFGVNLFAPNPMLMDRNHFHDYASYVQTEADAYGVDLRSAEPIEDDDEFHDKIDLLLSSPVPVVSFTFGIPDVTTVERLQRVGSVVVQTVTSANEARQGQHLGADVLVVQSTSAGGHVAAVLANGAEAAMVGTLLLRTNESGTSPTHKAALGDPGRTETVVTRAFTGRPARALRKAATAAGDPELINLWCRDRFPRRSFVVTSGGGVRPPSPSVTEVV